MCHFFSKFIGIDVCPAVPESKDEIHITGDIAFAVQQYLYATNDTDFLLNKGGFDMVKGIGEFWAGRVQYSNSLHAYTIYGMKNNTHLLVNSFENFLITWIAQSRTYFTWRW